MKLKWFDRREGQRRTSNRRAAEPAPPAVPTDRRASDRRASDRREAERRAEQRRQLFRLVYPMGEGPKVANGDYQVVDISQKAVRFTCKNGFAPNLELQDPFETTLRFHNDQAIDIKGRIFRLEQNDGSPETVFVCMLNEQIPQKIVIDEQRYLLKHFPDFCRTSFDRRNIIIED